METTLLLPACMDVCVNLLAEKLSFINPETPRYDILKESQRRLYDGLVSVSSLEDVQMILDHHPLVMNFLHASPERASYANDELKIVVGAFERTFAMKKLEERIAVAQIRWCHCARYRAGILGYCAGVNKNAEPMCFHCMEKIVPNTTLSVWQMPIDCVLFASVSTE